MLTENDVVAAVQKHLEARGFVVEQALDTTQRGIDLVATHPKKSTQVLVEAKGATSARVGSNRFGQEFSASQVRDHVANAVLAAAKLLTSHPGPSVSVVIAVPDNERHRKEIDASAVGLVRLGVSVWFVDSESRVHVWEPAA